MYKRNKDGGKRKRGGDRTNSKKRHKAVTKT